MENNSFDFLSNLPLIAFSFVFFVVFILFIRGGIFLIFTQEDREKIEKGRAIVLKALYSLFVLLLVVFVFFSVTHLLKKGEVLLPAQVPGDFPPSPDVNFPPAPEFIEVGGYYFVGPWLLEKNNSVNKNAIYTILCKKDGEYDIIYIGDTGGKENLLRNKQYSCWIKNCKLSNIYLAVFFTPIDKYDSTRRQEIRKGLEGQINPPCPPPESNSESN